MRSTNWKVFATKDLHGSPPVLPADVLYKPFTCGCPSYILVLKINKELLPTKKKLYDCYMRDMQQFVHILDNTPEITPSSPPNPQIIKISVQYLNLGFQDLALTEFKSLKALTFSNLQGHDFFDKSLSYCQNALHLPNPYKQDLSSF